MREKISSLEAEKAGKLMSISGRRRTCPVHGVRVRGGQRGGKISTGPTQCRKAQTSQRGVDRRKGEIIGCKCQKTQAEGGFEERDA